MYELKVAAIIPVKEFADAKTRLVIPTDQRKALCRIMLREMLHVLSMSPIIDQTVVVTREAEAIDMCRHFGAVHIPDEIQSGVNDAVALADKHLAENPFDASIVLPQDMPLIRTQDIDFVFRHALPPNFAIIVPSHKFDGTNALVRMPTDLMETHYDNDSYRMHMGRARECTPNASLVFAKRIMLDIDSMDDLRLVLQQGEKPDICSELSEVLDIQ